MPPNPKIPIRKPPRRAPAIPKRIVMIHPPGSLPGMRSLAIIPATRPTKIQLSMFILGLLLLLEIVYFTRPKLTYIKSHFFNSLLGILVKVCPEVRVESLAFRLYPGHHARRMGLITPP
jgi:hypothetical protein